MNPAHQAAGLPFDLSVRMRLVDKIVEEGRKMGKQSVLNIIEDDMYEDNIYY